jgi:FAD/FMN-containing dehydrogenase
MSSAERAAHDARRAAAAAQLRGAGAAPLGLTKKTSNLFRDRAEARKSRLDLRGFRNVLEVDAKAGWVDAEGLATFEDLVAACLPQGVMPAVVPQLKTITLGGAAAGVGIEATSFRHGLVHHGLLEIDVLLPDGEVVTATPDNGHRDLFLGFPNSYGTLGYALRLRQRTLPVKPLVRVEHRRFGTADMFFSALAAACAGTADFVDGVVVDPRTMIVNCARFAAEGPPPSDYGFEQIYWRSLLDLPVDHLSAAGYLWRWDTDWFWCSRHFGADRPWVRRLLGRRRLNSSTWNRLMRLNARWQLAQRWARWHGRHPESVIQDVDVPIDRAEEFLAFLLRRIGILPVWICPLRAPDGAPPFTLYPLEAGTLYVNFGFWDRIESAEPHAPGHFNRLIEREVARLHGVKSLYSDSYYTREEFARAYATPAYEALKRRYDPQRRLLGLYEKCVLRG